MHDILNTHINLIHSNVTLIWGVVCLLMGINLLVFNIPVSETVTNYRKSVRILAYNYLILSVLVFCMEFLGLRNSPDDFFTFPILLISTSQGLIFAYALVSLYAPRNFARRNILIFNILPLAVLVLLYFGFAVSFGDPVCVSFVDFISKLNQPTVLIRLLLLLFNVYQIVFYNAMLRRLALRYIKSLNQYYADTVQLKPKWAKNNFYLAVSVGVMSIVSSLFRDMLIDTLFTVLFCVYYFVFALMYMQYKHIFKKLEPEFIHDLQPTGIDRIAEKQTPAVSWPEIRRHIVDEKLYLQTGITVNDLAGLFRTNRTTFSNLLNKHECQNFNSFINHFRIEHAKQLLRSQQELSIAEIASLCGYTEQSNFTRQFKLLCGESPSVWAKQYRSI